MTISWITDEGKTGVAEDGYEFAMQHSEQPKPVADSPEPFSWQHVPGSILDKKSLQDSIDEDGPALIVPGVNDKHPKVQEFLKNPPPDFEIKHHNDLIYIRRKPGPEVASGIGSDRVASDQVVPDEPKVVGEEGIDMTYEKFTNFLGDLVTKMQGGKKMTDWTMKEHIGDFVSTAMSVLGGVRSPKMGTTRLYRAETSTLPGESPAPVPEWMANDPTVQGTLKATGRWFTNSKENAQWYVDKMGGKGISYVDVPSAEAQKYLASNHPEAKKYIAAGREGEEYFLPSDLASTRSALEEAKVTNVQSKVGKWTWSNPETIDVLKGLNEKGMTPKQIADEMGILPQQVYTQAKKNNIELNSGVIKFADMPHVVEKFKEIAARPNRMSKKEIASELGVSETTVQQLTKKYGYTYTAPNAAVDWTPIRDKELQYFRSQDLSFTEIGEKMGITRNQVAGRLSRLEKMQNTTPQKLMSEDREEGDYPPNSSPEKKAEWDQYWKEVKQFGNFMKSMGSIKTNEQALDSWIDNGPSSSQIEDRRPGHGGFPPRLPEPDFTPYKSGQLKKDLGFTDLTDAKIKQLARNYAKKASKK